MSFWHLLSLKTCRKKVIITSSLLKFSGKGISGSDGGDGGYPVVVVMMVMAVVVIDRVRKSYEHYPIVPQGTCL